MATPADSFFGRDKELTQLRRQIFGWGDQGHIVPVILLHGPSGAGKTALVEHFLSAFTGPGGSLRTVNFFWPGNSRTTTPDRFAELLLESARSSIPQLAGKGPTFRRSGSNAVAQPSGVMEQAAASDTYTILGQARETGSHPVYSGREAELTQSFFSSLVTWLASRTAENPLAEDASARLLFVFDRFEDYTIPVKKWLGSELYAALSSSEGIPRSAIILTGREPWELGSQADYWEAHPKAFTQLELGPLPRHVCQQWLDRRGLRAGLLDLLFEETEGFPGRIQEALLDVEQLKERHLSNFNPDDPLAEYTAQQRRWLHALAMLPRVNLEAIQVLLGRVEGLQAFGWASRNIGFCRVETEEDGEHVLVLTETIRTAALDLSLEKTPSRHREFLDKLEMIQELRAKVQSPQHRAKLRVLAPVQPFNAKLIEAVFHKNG